MGAELKKWASGIEPSGKRLGIYARLFGDLSNGHFHASEKNPAIVPFVDRLLGVISPSAVLRRIGSVVVDAINALFVFGARPHIGKKVLERRPAFANENAARAVVGVSGIGAVVAPLAHLLPCNVFWTVRKAVPSLGRANAFAMFAAAPIGLAASQVADVKRSYRSANASAFNEGEIVLPEAILDCSPVSECRTGMSLNAAHVTTSNGTATTYQKGAINGR